MRDILDTIGVLLLAVLTIFYKIFVSVKVWGYIAVKMFGAPEITIFQAVGIGLLLQTFIGFESSKDQNGGLEIILVRTLQQFIHSSLCWGLAYWFFA